MKIILIITTLATLAVAKTPARSVTVGTVPNASPYLVQGSAQLQPAISAYGLEQL
jgi:hypothetical protein